MSTTTASARRVCASPTPAPGDRPRALACTAAARAVGPAHAPRVAMRNYAQEDCARSQRPERAHACCRPPAALRACVERRHNALSARHPPQKQHTRWQPSSMRASRPRPARRRRRRARRPRRVAGASPLPVDTQMHSEQRRAKHSDCGNAFPLRWPPLGRKCISAEMHSNMQSRKF
jgi:hypothetical protein